eukprot:1496427-Pyramimonas_sp.AAC.1
MGQKEPPGSSNLTQWGGADHSKGYMQYLDQFLAQCRSCQVTPLDWHRSQAFPAEKHNNKDGII